MDVMNGNRDDGSKFRIRPVGVAKAAANLEKLLDAATRKEVVIEREDGSRFQILSLDTPKTIQEMSDEEFIRITKCRCNCLNWYGWTY